MHMHHWVHLTSQQAADQQKAKFLHLAGFPNVIGCINCNHVRILAPVNNEHEYVNRKNFHSINVQVTYSLQGARVHVIDVPAEFALKLQENSTTSCGCKHSCDVDRTISVSKGQITLYSLNRQVIKGSKP